MAIALAALDKLVQYVLTHDELRRTSSHETEQYPSPTALAADTAQTKAVAELSPFSDGEEGGRRTEE